MIITKVDIFKFSIPMRPFTIATGTMHFAQNRLHLIFKITLISCIIVVAGNLVLIPLFDARGAAIAYLIAMSAEYFLFLRSSALVHIRASWLPLLSCILISLLSGFIGSYFFSSVIMKLLVAVLLYIVLIVITKQVQKKDMFVVRKYFGLFK